MAEKANNENGYTAASTITAQTDQGLVGVTEEAEASTNEFLENLPADTSVQDALSSLISHWTPKSLATIMFEELLRYHLWVADRIERSTPAK